MPFSTMIGIYILFAPSQLKYSSLSFATSLSEGCLSGTPRAESSHRHMPSCFVHRQRLALVRGQNCIPTPLSPYPENSELKTKIMADISLYLEMLSLKPMAEHGTSEPQFPTPPSNGGSNGEMVHHVMFSGPEGAGSGLGQSGSPVMFNLPKCGPG